MFQEDRRFRTPSDDTKIWRYINYKKLQFLLDEKMLFFPTVEKLVKDDPYEGSSYACPLLSQVDPLVAQKFSKQMHSCGFPVAVNCWHINEEQSMAMWKLYSNIKGIAIQSTVGRLKQALEQIKDALYIGNIFYTNKPIEHPTGWTADLFLSCMTKRKCWEYENELRILIWDTEEIKRNEEGDALVPVNVNTLIENIYLSPTSEQDEINGINDLLQKYNVNIKPIKSELLIPPLF